MVLAVEQAKDRSPSERAARARRIKRNKEIVENMLLLVLVVFVALVITSRHATIAHLGYSIVSAREELRMLQAESQRLELEVARLQSLQRIESAAVTRLGMVKPAEIRLVAITRTEPVRVEEPVQAGAGFFARLAQSLSSFTRWLAMGDSKAEARPAK
ncbi:MAG: cell division protein FtsL [Bacillota bacterium]